MYFQFHIESAKKHDVEQFVSVVKTIIQTVEKEDKKSLLFDIKKRTAIMSAKHYTKIKINETTIMEYLQQFSYKDWLAITKSQNTIAIYETCDDYRRFCRLHYIEKRLIPTLARLIHYFGKSVPYSDTILYPLRIAGFVWKQLPGSKKAILVEKSKQFQKRIQYLQNMKEWRKSNLPILYVEFINLTDIARLKNQSVAVAVSTLTGLVDATFLQPKFQFSKLWLMEWTVRLVENLKNPHIIVLCLPEYNTEYKKEDIELNMSSPKKDMVEWLEFNDIPHTRNDHRAELYKLVQKLRNNCKPKPSIMEKLKSFGHHVVEQPRGIIDLTMIYATVKSKLVNVEDICGKKIETKSAIKNFLHEFTLKEWRNIDAKIRECEEKTYQHDMEMETVIDKLMELGKYGYIPEKEINSLDDFTPLLGRNKYMDMVIVD